MKNINWKPLIISTIIMSILFQVLKALGSFSFLSFLFGGICYSINKLLLEKFKKN